LPGQLVYLLIYTARRAQIPSLEKFYIVIIGILVGSHACKYITRTHGGTQYESRAFNGVIIIF